MGPSEELQLQRDIRRLVNERDLLNDRLRIRRGPQHNSRLHQRTPGSDTADGTLEAPAADQEKNSLKRPLDRNANLGENNGKFQFDGPDFLIEKRPKLETDSSTDTRNRRLLNVGILGHLHRARDQLKKEEDTKQAQLHRQQALKVEEKLQKASQNLAELKRRDFEERRNHDRMRVEGINGELAAKEYNLLRMHLIKHYQNMKNFIGTDAQPTVFWLPIKMTNETRYLQKQTAEFIEKKIESIKTTDFCIHSSQSSDPTIQFNDVVADVTMEDDSQERTHSDNDTSLKAYPHESNLSQHDADVCIADSVDDVTTRNDDKSHKSYSGDEAVASTIDADSASTVQTSQTKLSLNDIQSDVPTSEQASCNNLDVPATPEAKSLNATSETEKIENAAHTVSATPEKDVTDKEEKKPNYTVEQIQDMRVTDLKTALKSLGLVPQGKKFDLQQQLNAALGYPVEK